MTIESLHVGIAVFKFNKKDDRDLKVCLNVATEMNGTVLANITCGITRQMWTEYVSQILSQTILKCYLCPVTNISNVVVMPVQGVLNTSKVVF